MCHAQSVLGAPRCTKPGAVPYDGGMSSSREPDAQEQRTHTTEPRLRAVQEGEEGDVDWRSGIALDGAQEVVAGEAIERYLCNFNVTSDIRTRGWTMRGECVSTKRLVMDLVGYFPTVSERLLTSLLNRRVDEERFTLRRELSVKLCRGKDVAGGERELRKWVTLLCNSGTEADRVDYHAAAWKQLIWQVKRKIMGRDTGNDVMLVLSGAQGTGKSTAISHFVQPLDFLCMPEADFTVFSDPFRKHLFQSSYLIVLDEMSKAKGTDIEEIKRHITSSKVYAREMHSMSEVGYTRNASFIGATNRDVTTLLHDTTGMRRFCDIEFREGKADAAFRQALYAIDVPLMWQCVSHREDVPPAVTHAELFARYQDELVSEDPIDSWYKECVQPADSPTASIKGKTVWGSYQQWCAHHGAKWMLPKPFYSEMRGKVGNAHKRGSAVAFRGIALSGFERQEDER